MYIAAAPSTPTQCDISNDTTNLSGVLSTIYVMAQADVST